MRNVTIALSMTLLSACGQGGGTSGNGGTAATPMNQVFGGQSPCDKIAGLWRLNFNDGTEAVLRVDRSGEVYALSDRRTGPNRTPSAETFSGACANGIINTNSIIGNASYMADSDRLIFQGNQYNRSSEAAEATLAANKEAERIAQVQAAEAQAAEQRVMSSMQLDAYNCHDHWKESCSKTLQAHKDHPELAERVWAHNGVTLAQAQFDAGVPGAKSPVPATGSYIIVESARFNTPFTDQFAQPWEANVSHGDLGIRIKFEVVKISANRFRLCMNSPSFEEPVLKRAVMSTVSNPSDMQLIEEGSLHGACNKGR